jgi:hypothetical protein
MIAGVLGAGSAAQVRAVLELGVRVKNLLSSETPYKVCIHTLCSASKKARLKPDRLARCGGALTHSP